MGMGLAATVLPLAAPVRARAQTAASESFVLTASEGETLRAIVARIIPSDENGPGALEARADRYIDRALAGALKASRPAYATGLAAVNARRIVEGRHSQTFRRRSGRRADIGAADFRTILQPDPHTHHSRNLFGSVLRRQCQLHRLGSDWLSRRSHSVSADLQRMDKKPEPSRKSAYDYGMFSKGEV